MKRTAGAVVLALFVLGGLAVAVGVGVRDKTAERSANGTYRGSKPPAGVRLPEFALRNHTGKLVRTRDLRGKVVLITFLDSQCTESCPVIASRIARTIDLLNGDERRDVEAVAISTDPAEDTASSVRAFLRKQRALGRLRYLTGSERAMRSVWKAFNVLSSLETGKDTLHSAPVRVYDRQGIWVSTLRPGVDLTPDNLADDARLALEQG